MPIAIVLVEIKSGSKLKVLSEALNEIDGVFVTVSVLGVCDIVALIEAKDMDELKKLVSWHIRSTEGVESLRLLLDIENLEIDTWKELLSKAK